MIETEERRRKVNSLLAMTETEVAEELSVDQNADILQSPCVFVMMHVWCSPAPMVPAAVLNVVLVQAPEKVVLPPELGRKLGGSPSSIV
jgi:hypothetical protein